ncbi:hypothetical protein [Cyclobacterium plantarum]|uniref:Uncharacterized protein n=1 Tax=Cyclobacterium plantarum TaxID=2716263 RepID=A0ABX0H0R2_9BACT|nr:hypothetical protein [Cyclobacterium plantarum]NHE55379.1 hypothetical protein [Cyclobacterium plantarum]
MNITIEKINLGKLNNVSKITLDKEGQLYTPTKGAAVFLSVLTKDFSLIAEYHFQSMDARPPFHFSKDGKLWLFENLEDEMGFVRMDITW